MSQTPRRPVLPLMAVLLLVFASGALTSRLLSAGFDKLGSFMATHLGLALGAVATLVGLVIAVWQTLLAFRWQKKAEESQHETVEQGIRLSEQATNLTEQVKAMEKRLSTEPLGPFPNYLTKVAQLIEQSSSSIRILAMVPSHGSFTDYSQWRKIDAALSDIEAKKQMNSAYRAEVVYASDDITSRIWTVYQSDANGVDGWKLWKQDKEKRDRLSHFLKRMQVDDLVDIDDLTREDYIALRLDDNLEAEVKSYQHFQRYCCEESMPVFCWIADDVEAIFSFSTEDKSGFHIGAAIRTRDPNIVLSLQRMFQHYRGLSKLEEPKLRPISTRARLLSKRANG